MTYRRRLIFPALVAAGILWGTTVPLSKLALGWLAPGWLAFARFALAGALLMVISRSRLRAALSPAILITGAAGYGGSVLLQNLGIERTSVTHAALLIGATPVLVAVLAAMLGHGVARPVSWLGFGLSLAGVLVIASGHGGGSSLTGDGLVLASQLACAGFIVSQARLLRGRDPVAVTALQLVAAALAVLPAALAGGPVALTAGRPSAVLATAALVLAGTVLPTTLFAFAQGRVSADVAGAFLNLEPLFGAAIGIVLFGNPLGPAQVAGGAAVVAGIGLSSYQVVRQERAGRRRGPGRAGARRTRPGLALSGAESYPGAERQIARRPADVHGELAAWGDPAGQRLVVAREQPGWHGDPDPSRVTCGGAHDREGRQHPERASSTRRVARLGQIHLNALLARSGAGVADLHGQLEIGALARRRRAVDGVVVPGRVPEPRAERVAPVPAGVVPAVADQQTLGIAGHVRRGRRGVQDGTVGRSPRSPCTAGQSAASSGAASWRPSCSAT